MARETRCDSRAGDEGPGLSSCSLGAKVSTGDGGLGRGDPPRIPALNMLHLVVERRCRWRRDDGGLVVLEPLKWDKAWKLRLAAFFDLKDRMSMHLDERGSAAWALFDGKRTVGEAAEVMEARFRGGDEAQRLADFVGLLESNRLVTLRTRSGKSPGEMTGRPAGRGKRVR